MRRRTWIRGLTLNLLLLAVSLGVTLVSAELILQSYRPPAVSPHGYRVPHPEWGWRLKPGANIVIRKTDFQHEVRINDNGWRGPLYPYPKPPDHLRIIVLGDSFMEAYSVHQDESFSRRLESLILQEQPVEVINLGVGGYGTLQEYLVYRDEGRRYSPDMVLLAFLPGNDVRNNSLQLERTFYHDRRDHYKLLSRPFLRASEGPWEIIGPDIEQAVEAAERRRRRLDSLPWWKRTALWNLGREANRSMSARSRNGAVTEALDLSIWLGPYLCDPPEAYAEAWAITRRILRRLRDEVAADGAVLIVFTVPGLQDVDDVVLRDAASAIGPNVCHNSALATQRSQAMLRELKIPFLDLRPILRHVDPPKSLYHFEEDRHWNAAGHDLAARAVHRYLNSEKFLGR